MSMQAYGFRHLESGSCISKMDRKAIDAPLKRDTLSYLGFSYRKYPLARQQQNGQLFSGISLLTSPYSALVFLHHRSAGVVGLVNKSPRETVTKQRLWSQQRRTPNLVHRAVGEREPQRRLLMTDWSLFHHVVSPEHSPSTIHYGATYLRRPTSLPPVLPSYAVSSRCLTTTSSPFAL